MNIEGLVVRSPSQIAQFTPDEVIAGLQGTGGTGIGTASPVNNGKFLKTSGGAFVWAQITDSGIATGADIAVAKLHASTASVTGQPLVTRAGTVTWETGGIAKLTYHARNYAGWHDDDTLDDLAATQLALNDACVTGGEVLIEAKHGVWNSGATALKFPADLTNGVVIRGLGINITTIRLGLDTRTFLEPDGVLTTNAHTYQNIEVRDLTIDAKNFYGTARPTNVTAHYGVIFADTGVKANYANLTFRRIRTKNVGPLTVDGMTSTDGRSTAINQERRNINIAIGTTPDGIAGATAYTVKNILCEDLDLGYSNPYNSGDGTGGGGNVGILIQGFYGGNRYPNLLYNQPYVSNVWIENIVYRRCFWDSGQTPISDTQPNQSGMGSAGFMIGGNGYGDNWLVEECYSKNAGDVNFEMDSARRVRLVRCHAEDGWNVGFYFANIGAGADTYGYADTRQHILLDSCTSEKRLAVGSNMHNLLVAQPQFAVPNGTVTVNDFTSIVDMAELPGAGSNPVEFRGDIRKLTIRNLRSIRRYATAAASTFTDRAVNIALRAGRSDITIDGLYDDLELSATGGVTFTAIGYALHAADATVRISGVHCRHRGVVLSGGSSLRSWEADWFQTGGQNASDAFGATSGTLTQNYLDVTGTGLADITQSGGTLNTPLNPTVEKRFLWLMNGQGSSWQNTGPTTDGSLSIKSTPGSTLTSHKTGIILKADPRDATTYLEAYVTDDGANSTLLIDKILAGARTNLVTSASLGTRISNGTAYWVRAKISGNVVTADYYTSAPGAISGSGATTVTTTLTGADVYKVGEQMQGRCGFSWTPQDTAATLDDLKIDWFMVLRGVVEGCGPMLVAGPASQAYGINFEYTAGTWRYPGGLKLRHNDWTALEGNTSMIELKFADSTMQTSLLAAENAYTTPPAAAAVTVTASPFTYTNSTYYRQRVGTYGGTVSAISVTDRAGTTTQLGGSTNMQVVLDPGEAVVVTYTVAPTMNEVPIR